MFAENATECPPSPLDRNDARSLHSKDLAFVITANAVSAFISWLVDPDLTVVPASQSFVKDAGYQILPGDQDGIQP